MRPVCTGREGDADGTRGPDRPVRVEVRRQPRAPRARREQRDLARVARVQSRGGPFQLPSIPADRQQEGGHGRGGAETRPVSTGGGTRRVQSVPEGGEGGGSASPESDAGLDGRASASASDEPASERTSASDEPASDPTRPASAASGAAGSPAAEPLRAESFEGDWSTPRVAARSDLCTSTSSCTPRGGSCGARRGGKLRPKAGAVRTRAARGRGATPFEVGQARLRIDRRRARTRRWGGWGA